MGPLDKIVELYHKFKMEVEGGHSPSMLRPRFNPGHELERLENVSE
ncbi:putative integrase [Sulfurisphaera javensis]